MAALSEALEACIPATGPIRDYLDWACPLSHTPAELHIGAIYPLLGWEACRRGLWIPFGYGSPRPWIAIVAGSGISKTSTVARMQDFSRDWLRKCYRDGAGVDDPWVSLEGSLPGVVHALSQKPFVNGVTPAILTHNEFDRPLRSEDTSSMLNMIYDGRDYERNLRYLQKLADKGEDVEHVLKKPAMTAIVTTTPASFERVIRPEVLQGGLFARFSWVHAKLRPDQAMAWPREDADGREFVLDRWERWWRSLEGYRTRGLKKRIRFTIEAATWLEEQVFDAFVRPHVGSETFEGTVFNRTMPKVCHFAALNALSRLSIEHDQVVVHVEDVWRASNLVLRSNQDAVHLGTDATSHLMQHKDIRKRILVELNKVGNAPDILDRGLTRAQIYRSFSGNIRKPLLDEALASMQDADEVLEVIVRDGRPGRPPTRVYPHAVGWEVTAVLSANGTGTTQ